VTKEPFVSTLTNKQAYAATFYFLDQQWNRTKSRELGFILGDMALLPDGSPADPAVPQDWQKAVESALKGTAPGDLMTDTQAYAAMVCYLDQQYRQTKVPELGGILRAMAPLEDGLPGPFVIHYWREAVDYALKGGAPGNLDLPLLRPLR
jgi:hypothetical protein